MCGRYYQANSESSSAIFPCVTAQIKPLFAFHSHIYREQVCAKSSHANIAAAIDEYPRQKQQTLSGLSVIWGYKGGPMANQATGTLAKRCYAKAFWMSSLQYKVWIYHLASLQKKCLPLCLPIQSGAEVTS